MAQLLENTQRHVNIAMVNEMAVFCHELGVDLRDAIQCAATKPLVSRPSILGPGRRSLTIPIDPNHLSYKVRTLGYRFRFVELAQEINGKMPTYVADRAAELLNDCGKALKGARATAAGGDYKKDVADQRESLSQAIARKRSARGQCLSDHDPHELEMGGSGDPIPQTLKEQLNTEVASADWRLLQDHSSYDLYAISRTALPILDTRGRVVGPHVRFNDLTYESMSLLDARQCCSSS